MLKAVGDSRRPGVGSRVDWIRRGDHSVSWSDPAYAFHRSVPFGIRRVSVESNVVGARAIASAAVGRSSSVQFVSGRSSTAVVPVVSSVGRGSVVYYGCHGY